MNVKTEDMSFYEVCSASHILANYRFPERCAAVYRDCGYLAHYLEDRVYIVRKESGSDIVHLVKAANPHEAICKVAFDHADENHRLFVEGSYQSRRNVR